MFKGKVQFISAVLACSLILGGTAAFAAGSAQAGAVKGIFLKAGSKKAIVNDKAVSLTAAPSTKNNTTIVPIRLISESLGAAVKWNKERQEISIINGSDSILLTLNKTVMKVNDKNITLQAAPQLIGGGTFVPIRAVAEAFGKQVLYENGVIFINGEDEPVQTAQQEELFNKVKNYFVALTKEDIQKILKEKNQSKGKVTVSVSEDLKSAEVNYDTYPNAALIATYSINQTTGEIVKDWAPDGSHLLNVNYLSNGKFYGTGFQIGITEKEVVAKYGQPLDSSYYAGAIYLEYDGIDFGSTGSVHIITEDEDGGKAKSIGFATVIAASRDTIMKELGKPREAWVSDGEDYEGNAGDSEFMRYYLGKYKVTFELTKKNGCFMEVVKM